MMHIMRIRMYSQPWACMAAKDGVLDTRRCRAQAISHWLLATPASRPHELVIWQHCSTKQEEMRAPHW
eukprot:59272-Chlamydomonas_euryale.AAC.5